jgi:hypothetical protein
MVEQESNDKDLKEDRVAPCELRTVLVEKACARVLLRKYVLIPTYVHFILYSINNNVSHFCHSFFSRGEPSI